MKKVLAGKAEMVLLSGKALVWSATGSEQHINYGVMAKKHNIAKQQTNTDTDRHTKISMYGILRVQIAPPTIRVPLGCHLAKGWNQASALNIAKLAANLSLSVRKQKSQIMHINFDQC